MYGKLSVHTDGSTTVTEGLIQLEVENNTLKLFEVD